MALRSNQVDARISSLLLLLLLMSRGAWEATVHRVAEGQTRLSDFTSHIQYHSDISAHFTPTFSFYLLFMLLYLKKNHPIFKRCLLSDIF